MTWQPPPWARFLGRSGQRAYSGARQRPGRALGSLAIVLAVLGTGVIGVRWWKHRPRPTEVIVTVTAPPATPIEVIAKPLPVVIDFSASVAQLSKMSEMDQSSVTLSPRVEGKWRWRSDHELEFMPKTDWPVGQHYSVRLAKTGLVREKVVLDQYKVEFDSAKFTVEETSKEFYQDPVDPSMRKAVVTYTFSHPVDSTSFEKALQLTLVPGTKQESERPYEAQVSYDKLRGHAYVHSLSVDIPQHDATMHIVVDKGVRSRLGGSGSTEQVVSDVAIAGLYNLLKIDSSALAVVDNERNEPEQVVVLTTTVGVSEAEMKRNVEAWVLPRKVASAPNEKEHDWSNQAENVDAAVLAGSKKLELVPIAQEAEYTTTHSFRFKAEVGRFVYVVVKKDLRAFGGYLLAEPFLTTARVPVYPRQLRILHSGALLSLSGEKKVSVFARDVPGMQIEVSRVLPEQLTNVVSQSYGTYANPVFSGRYDIDNAAEKFTDTVTFGNVGTGKPNYQAVDLTRWLGDGKRGVFWLKVSSWDPGTKSVMGENDARLIVVTDLGILTKETGDGEREVYVASIRTGEPVGGAKISILGKNGLPVFTDSTDADGRLHVGSLRTSRHEKEPVLVLATKGKDSSFLPVGGAGGSADRYLDESRFDVGGAPDEHANAMSAYVFSDRGVYRPGEELRMGLIVRANDWRTSLDGVPIEVQVTDPRGLVVKKERVRLTRTGLVELRHTTPDTAPTGTYTVQALLVEHDRAGDMLGSTTVRVREFMPDKMKLAVHFSAEHAGGDGWVSPDKLQGRITLTNLYGTPAEGRVVRAKMSLSPALPSFPRLRDYTFFDPLLAKESADEELNEVKTDGKGEAVFDMQLQRWKPATYRLTLSAEGFEEGAGHGVSAEAQVVVSPMPFLVGYKADGDLGYLSKGAGRKVELIAVGPAGDKIAATGLRAVLLERKFVSVLTKQPSGTYKYESVKREVELEQKPLVIGADGSALALPTGKPGDFSMVVRNQHDLDLQKIDFTVAGTANLTRSMEKNAELGLKLKQKDVDVGGTIEMQLKAPYTGAGLITIERDKVYAHKWFKATTNASVQTIEVPEGLEGGGYVSVAYLRDAGSDEVFASPLSYAIAPFSISRKKREAKVTVDIPEMSRPGEPLAIKVKADRPTKAIVLAVDEGILRVADWKTPDPLAFFFQKRALGVRTAQILDLVLPDFSRLMSAVAPGGDDEGGAGANLNPFKRKHDAPVAFWSGIIDIGPSGKTLIYDVPDYFNGSLRVVAIAVEPQSVGIAERKMIVRGDYVISPSVPLAVAPGDEFELTATIANNVEKSGEKATVDVALSVSPGLEIVGEKKVQLQIGAMREAGTSFKLRATEALGPATATLVASGAGKPARLRSELSVRPAVPYTVTFQAGHMKDGEQRAPIQRELYPELRTLNAGLSRLPLGLTHGLAAYLEKFPHGCTEQITSQAVPAIALGKHAEFGIASDKADAAFARWIDLLRARQNDDGAFGMWAASPRGAPLPSVWALLVMQEAKERGLDVPADMQKSGQAYLQAIAAREGESLADERLRAMAIYTLTRMGQVTTSYASSLKKRLEADFATSWKKDIAAAYLGSTLALLKQTDKARSLVSELRFEDSITPDWEHYYDPLARNAQLLYLLARHFPERAQAVTQAQIDHVVEPVFGGSYNTFSSAFTILALEAYGQTTKAAEPKTGLSLVEELASGKHQLALPDSLLPVTSFSADATALDFVAKGDFGAYWLVEQAGYDRKVPTDKIAKRVEVFREYTDAAGKRIDKVTVGDELRVHVRLRSLDQTSLTDVAIVDLLPGGFEVVMQEKKRRSGTDEHDGEEHAERGSAEPHESEEGAEEQGDDADSRGDDDVVGPYELPITVDGTTMTLDFGDVREDRVLLYTHAETDVKELVYVLRATNAGTYRVAPVLVTGMYDRSVLGRDVGGTITVQRR